MTSLSAIIRLALISALGLGRLSAAAEVDPAKWALLQQGMTETEVTGLLGTPLRRDNPASNNTTLTYGEIAPKSDLFPDGLAYIVWLDDGKKVNYLQTPFGGMTPRNGLPGRPSIFLPQPNITFDHYPRILDIRWYAVVGTYPMEYEVEHDSGYAPEGTIIWHTSKTLKVRLPHMSLQHVGGQPGRVRVRGINAEGSGPWSDYVVFEFTR